MSTSCFSNIHHIKPVVPFSPEIAFCFLKNFCRGLCWHIIPLPLWKRQFTYYYTSSSCTCLISPVHNNKKLATLLHAASNQKKEIHFMARKDSPILPYCICIVFIFPRNIYILFIFWKYIRGLAGWECSWSIPRGGMCGQMRRRLVCLYTFHCWLLVINWSTLR